MGEFSRRSEAWFRALMEQSPLSTQVFSPDGKTIEVNRAWERLWGGTIKHVADYNILQDAQLAERGILAYIQRGFAGEATAVPAVWYDPNDTLEDRSTRPDPRRWVRAFIHPIKDETGKVTEVVLIHEDMTEQKLAELAAEENALQLRLSEERFRQSEQRFTRFMQHLPGLAWIKDLDGRYRYSNEAALRAFGRSAIELYGRTDDELFPSKTAQQFLLNDRRALASGSGIQVVESLVHDDGTEHHSLVSKFPIFSPDGAPLSIGGMAIDITELKRAQDALRDSEERFRGIVSQSIAGVAEVDLQGRFLFANDHYCMIVGRSRDELLKLTMQQISHPDDLEQNLAHFKKLASEGIPFVIEKRYLRSDGTVVWVNNSVFGLADHSGRIKSIVAVCIDITNSKRAEDALRMADRRKNEFLATLAHELRNPLAPIRNSLQLLKLAGDNPDLQLQARSIMERQLQQMVRLIDDLLDVSRITRNRLELRLERMTLSTAVHSAVEASRALVESLGHQLTISLPAEPVWLNADHARLTQVIANLLNNAAKYTDRGGNIWLSAQLDNDGIVLSVRDSGIGIASEHLPHIFEMFSQVNSALDRSDGGLGIGLALVQGLVEMHGGHVQAISQGLGRGSEFKIWLPVSKVVAAGQVDGSMESTAPAAKDCRVLVVDDNRDGAESLALTLRLSGYETHSAHDGIEALAAAEWFRPRIVLLDIGMPKLNGYEVAKRIRAASWGQEITLVAVTGWGQAEDKDLAKDAGFDYHLTKPVEYGLLWDILKKCISQ